MDITMTPQAIWLEIRTHLEKKKRQINEQILNYPPPIPACDVQFNHLLEERTRITQELRRALDVSANSANSADSILLLRAFIETCAYIDDNLAKSWELEVAHFTSPKSGFLLKRNA